MLEGLISSHHLLSWPVIKWFLVIIFSNFPKWLDRSSFSILLKKKHRTREEMENMMSYFFLISFKPTHPPANSDPPPPHSPLQLLPPYLHRGPEPLTMLPPSLQLSPTNHMRLYLSFHLQITEEKIILFWFAFSVWPYHPHFCSL